MIFNLVQENDITPLQNRIDVLEFELKVQKENNVKLNECISILNSKIQALNEYCYNMSGDVALLRKTGGANTTTWSQ